MPLDFFLTHVDLAPDNLEHYKQIKTEYRKLEHDFNVLTKIATSVSTLYQEYEVSAAMHSAN